jgi:SAM-dependent methyltransferase
MRMNCNVCGGERFADQSGRPGARCVECGSLERTRVMKLFLDSRCVLEAGCRVFHLAPEKGIYDSIRKTKGVHYEVVDFEPELYGFAPVKKFDVTLDVEHLPSRHYDIVIHSHVMEHVRCNVSAALFHLHRSLKDGGKHLISIPITGSSYESDLGGVSDEDRVRRFGQKDHFRRFGASDLQRTFGMVFSLPERYELTDYFTTEMLDRHNIPAAARSGFTSHSVFCFGKNDLKLRSDA